jgi:hypothetical protein
LNNDLATLAKEIKEQAGSASEFNKMNRIQQEAIAKSVGMTANSLSDALFEQEALTSLGKQLNNEEKRAFETLKEKYGVEEATRRIKDGQLESLVAQQSTAEKFADIMSKVQEIFVAMAEPILGLVNGIMNMVGGAENLARVLKIIAAAYIAIRGAQMISLLLKKKETAEELKILGIKVGQATATSIINPIAALAGLALAGIVGSLIYSSVKGDDIISPGENSPGYGKRTLFGPEGAIELNNKDSIIAGTNLFDKNKSQSSSPQSTTVVDMTKTNTLLQQLIDLISAGGDVVLDGQKVGVALNLVSYKTQ